MAPMVSKNTLGSIWRSLCAMCLIASTCGGPRKHWRIAQALAAAPVRYRTDWRNVRGKIVLRRSGKPRLQALHTQPLLW